MNIKRDLLAYARIHGSLLPKAAKERVEGVVPQDKGVMIGGVAHVRQRLNRLTETQRRVLLWYHLTDEPKTQKNYARWHKKIHGITPGRINIDVERRVAERLYRAV